MHKITIDPISRIEGHMKVEVTIDAGEVREAKATGTLFRGFEMILHDRHPYDAVRLTQRVCGVCPMVHATASALCVDSALGIDGKIPDNGRIIRNLVLGANFLQSHILHFYALAALDFVDVTAILQYSGADPALTKLKEFAERGELAPFMPRYEGDYRLTKEQNIELAGHYLQALHMRRLCHEMLSIYGGKMPHDCVVVPGGASAEPLTEKSARFLGMLSEISRFVDQVYIPDVMAVAKAYPDYFTIGKGCGEFLSYGAFDLAGGDTNLPARRRFMPQGVITDGKVSDVDATKIKEEVIHSWYEDGSGGSPLEERTTPAPGKANGYSWLKSPRYGGKPKEVGPLARTLVAYHRGAPEVKSMVDGVLGAFKAEPSALLSVLGRHAARAIDAKLTVKGLQEWVTQVKPGEPVCADLTIPNESEGMGLTEGPRGALGHWIRIKDKVIDNYQLVVPTTWNGGPADAAGQPGPIEQALIGTKIKDDKNPFEVVRIIRSFDPCLACSVHMVDMRGNTTGVVRIA